MTCPKSTFTASITCGIGLRTMNMLIMTSLYQRHRMALVRVGTMAVGGLLKKSNEIHRTMLFSTYVLPNVTMPILK